jgi:tRNA (guanine37-N1)-methyltransferase
VPGVLGAAGSALTDSFSDGLLEYPQYTRPVEYNGMRVPEVLASGNHQAIATWRRREQLRRTFERRPELLKTAPLTDEDRRYLAELRADSANPDH